MAYQPVFPLALQPAASALLGAMTASALAPAQQGFRVTVQGESLSAPARLYCSPSELRALIEQAAGDSRTLALCLGTRHWDGHVREECLRRLISTDRPWVAPFFVQLLGEYVIEIVEVIAEAVRLATVQDLCGFARENPKFMALTRQRATSYWDCYFRRRFGSLQTYPAIAVLNAIDVMARSQ
ncbi:hypothetical protein SNE35_09605 [Paucibacter sp. R3-3]|uniref:Uncharacterized protein n=1 Tax=Roseateles agri TaxID=3098619 RepID=A0ABU5DHQ9_9BURK|nr:hypothetical protein [Paucibacter sp. R3-3]MDY0744764.1 hypothetical protein [Paucibacter sp. R3-3]